MHLITDGRMNYQLNVDAFSAWGSQVVIPAKLQSYVLGELHMNHHGIVRMKTLSSKYLYGSQMLTKNWKSWSRSVYMSFMSS